MKPAAERAVVHEVDRQTKAVVDIVSRWPEYRSHVAYAMLGAAVATCDTFGPVDGEPIEDVVFTRRVDANLMVRAFRRADRLEGIDTQIGVTKYVPQEPKR